VFENVAGQVRHEARTAPMGLLNCDTHGVVVIRPLGPVRVIGGTRFLRHRRRFLPSKILDIWGCPTVAANRANLNHDTLPPVFDCRIVPAAWLSNIPINARSKRDGIFKGVWAHSAMLRHVIMKLFSVFY
jgi:hypothetical protein